MSNLYEITKDYKEVENILMENGGELTEDLEIALASIEGSIQEKATNIIHIIKKQDDYIALIDKEMERLKLLKKVRVITQNRVTEYLKKGMEYLDKKELDLGTVVLKIAKNPPSIEVTDESLIPAEYFNITTPEPIRKLDKGRLKDFLKGEGHKVGGAELKTDGTRLKIQ